MHCSFALSCTQSAASSHKARSTTSVPPTQTRDEAKASHVIMVAWSMATLGALTPARWGELLELTPEMREPSHAGNHGRLLQIALYLEMETGDSYRAFLPPSVLEQVVASARADNYTVSFLQSDVLVRGRRLR